MFVDFATVHVKAGDGGRGLVSFRREKFVEKGGPDGGDGGRGGDIIFKARYNVNTLAKYRHSTLIKANDGASGGKRKRRGRSANDVTCVVPVGTVIYEGDEIVADLKAEGDSAVVAKGGDGGFGNAHFKSSVRQAPRIAEKGEPGDTRELTLELKLVADVGLAGLPNAGKSTLLATISNAKPKIANYPFTTLVPNLGVVDMGSTSLTVADIPGMIEGASEGKGLGDEFLRHIERTNVIVHLIDATSPDLEADYQTIKNELDNHQELADKVRLITLNKIDSVYEDEQQQRIDEFVAQRQQEDLAVERISAVKKTNVSELLGALQTMVADVAEQQAEDQAQDEEAADSTKVYTLETKPDDWWIEDQDDSVVLRGEKIEKFAVRTDPANYHSKLRLLNILERSGMLAELEKRGFDIDEDPLRIGDVTLNMKEL